MFIFQWIRCLDAFMFFGWETDHPLGTYATVGMGCHRKCAQLRTRGGGATTYKNICIILKTEGPYVIDYITFYYLIYSLYALIYFYITDNVTFLKHLHQHISYSGSDRRSNLDYENYRKYGSWKVSFSSYRALKREESQISIF